MSITVTTPKETKGQGVHEDVGKRVRFYTNKNISLCHHCGELYRDFFSEANNESPVTQELPHIKHRLL